MLQECSGSIEAQRTADAAVHPETKFEFVSPECLWSKARFLTLESRWSFLERLYALPF
jgi:hypothetical protein